MKRISLVVLILAIAVAQGAKAGDGKDDRDSLRGVKTMYVLVDGLPPGAQRLSLDKGTIQTQVELKLRLAGITVVTAEQGYTEPGQPFLYINVNLRDPGLAGSVDVEFDQNVILERNATTYTGAATWSKGMLIQYPSAQGIRQALSDRVDDFVNAWLSVNPK